MNSRISVGLVIVAALVLSLVPAAAITARPAEAVSTCDWAQFVADVTIPDGTGVAPGATFTKTWRLKNIGTCTWRTSYALVYSSGDEMGGSSPVSFPGSVVPGQTVDISVNLTAPSAAGHYIGYWKFKNASGDLFGIGSTAGKAWWVEINVTGGPSTAGVAYDFAANYCSANWYSTQGSLPCAGAEGDARGFVTHVNQPRLENGATDPGVGLLTVPQNAYNGDIHGAFGAFHVQIGDHFQSIINCAYGATNCDVTFRLDYQIGGGPINTFWSFGEKYDGLFSRADVDLSSLAGQDVSFILTVLANGPATRDGALWVNPVITRAGSTPPVPNARKFDFGTSTSPVAPGYVRVTETTAYTAGAYGWTTASGAQSMDRSSQADPLKRDFVMSGTTAPTFRVDLPTGNYAVTVTMGDNDAAHDNMIVKANGKVMLADVDTAAGSFAVNTFIVAVSSGPLTLQFLDSGGTDSIWVVNGVSIAATSQPPTTCDRAQFIADVTVPDGTVFAPGSAFTKTWRLKNASTCTWTTFYAMVFDTGEKMGGTDLVNLPHSVAPGQTVDMSVNLTAPGTAGSYRGYWKFQDSDGVRFGLGSSGTKSWWVDIKVSGTTITPTQPPSGCDRAQFIADITVPDGTVFAPGAQFDKIWRLKNVGTCTWTTSYAMVFDSGEKMGGTDSVAMPVVVPPRSSVDLLVHLTAPSIAGSYRSYWKFQNANGVRFGLGSSGTKSWWVDIKVSGTTITPTPTPTGTGTDTTGWSTYVNGKYSFSFKYPPGSTIVSQSDNAGRVDLPFTAGTTLKEKWVDVTIVEGANPCKSPNAGQVASSENVTINGIQFLKELGMNGTAGHFYDITAYSTLANNACISLTFQLRSIDPGVLLTPPPAYDKAAESGVFPIIMSTFTLSSPPATATSTPPAATSTPTLTPTPAGTDTTGWNVYANARYGFSFKYPPGSTVVSQSDTGGRLYLPFAAGTNLLQKYLDVNVAEGVSPCKASPGTPPTPPENVTINGIPFLKETWENGATSHSGDFTAYSTVKGNACISLTFWLWSVVPEVMETPPPRFDPVAESAVFTKIMATYANQ